MKALILAAGKGIRLRPITLEKPKPLIEVAGKPFLHFLIANLKKAGFNDIALIVNYKKELIEDFLKKNGLKAKLIPQDEPLGTAHAIKCAEQWAGNDDFVVLMGDNLYSAEDLKAMKKSDEFCYIAGTYSDTPEKYGVLLSRGNTLIKIVEKPKELIGNIVNTGLYKFTPEIFRVINMTKKSDRGEYEITDALSMLARDKKVRVIEIKGYWMKLDSQKDIENLNNFLSEANYE
jgi:NDP-sugar pyrophosphorylase family protein